MYRVKLMLLSLFCIPSFVFPSEYDVDYFSTNFENDSFFHEDDGYSNGITFNWGYYNVLSLNGSSLSNWLSFLADESYINSFEDRQYQIDYTVGQFIQTATDIKISELIENDAPYVGLIAWKGNISAYNSNTVDKLAFTLGFVGPDAGGEFVQTDFHNLIGTVKPEGWDNQINNEVVFRVESERLWRYPIVLLEHSEIDIITGINAGVGNLLSDANAGVSIRWGEELASNFSSNSPFLVQKLNGLKANPNGWYTFASLSTSYVLNDIFIDGNTFTDSHSVDLIHWQASVAVGIQVNIEQWNVIFAMLQATNQYETQSDKTRWGNMTVTHHF